MKNNAWFIVPFVFVILFGCHTNNSGSSAESFYPYYKQEQLSEIEQQTVIDHAKKVEGYPYTWGGDSTSIGFDCSGLIQWIYRQMGIVWFRNGNNVFPEITAHNLYRYNVIPINFENLKSGDFIFFDENLDGNITHNSIFDSIDESGNIWVYDAYSVTGRVEHRIVHHFWNKNPVFGKPLKTIDK